MLGHRDKRFLNDILRLGVSEPRLARHTVDELPIDLEKFFPTCVILPVLQPADEAGAGGNEFVVTFHNFILPSNAWHSHRFFFRLQAVVAIWSLSRIRAGKTFLTGNAPDFLSETVGMAVLSLKANRGCRIFNCLASQRSNGYEI